MNIQSIFNDNNKRLQVSGDKESPVKVNRHRSWAEKDAEYKKKRQQSKWLGDFVRLRLDADSVSYGHFYWKYPNIGLPTKNSEYLLAKSHGPPSSHLWNVLLALPHDTSKTKHMTGLFCGGQSHCQS